MYHIHILIFISLLTSNTLNLHLLDNTQAQIDALKTQQDNFEKSVNKLVANITKIEQQLNSTSSTDQKIIILENAIISERESVFELSKIIIPPFNISKDGCEKMTDQQKVELLEQLSLAREEVYELRNISNTMPDCPDVSQIKRDIEKQIFFLNSIESIIYTNCSMNVILSPTIFQTNIYAPNWVLGNMTIDDLIEQYYQRSIRYDNITNCPIDFPFFDGKKCINCSTSTPAFDISQKKCIACPGGNTIDNDQKKCVSCPNGTVFNNNTKTCTHAEANMITRLAGTRWITPTPNVTNVLKERANLIAENKTSGKYHECSIETPYYDGFTCISCPNEFNLTSLKCTQSPSENFEYTPNLHVYLENQNKETNPNATNIIGNKPTDTSTSDCNATHPYYDGVACINCPTPFTLFDVSSKRCVVCDPDKLYNSTSRSCEPRPIIYISKNDNNLLATSQRSIDAYHNNVTNTIQANNNSIIQNCPSDTQYSDYKSCFNCPQYFNVYTLRCANCTTKYNTTTKLCEESKPRYSNLNNTYWTASNLSQVVEERNQRAKVPGATICELSAPHYDGFSCIACNNGEFFNYDTHRCEACQGSLVFDVNVHQCIEKIPVGKYQTNVESPNLIYGGKSKAEWQANYRNNQTAYPGIQDCPTTAPYYDTINCIQCPETVPYFHMEYNLCMRCPDGTTYTETTAYKGCLDNGTGEQRSISPDIAKMYANIF